MRQVQPLVIPTHATTIHAWLVTDNDSHPVFSQYFVSLVHLRDVPGATTPVYNFEGATHELIIFAVNPERGVRHIDDVQAKISAGSMIPLVRPINVIQQLAAGSDAHAVAKVGTLLDMAPSMDSAHRSFWEQELGSCG